MHVDANGHLICLIWTSIEDNMHVQTLEVVGAILRPLLFRALSQDIAPFKLALPTRLLVSIGGRHSQRLGPSPTLASLGPSHQQCHKSQVSPGSHFCPWCLAHSLWGDAQHKPLSCFMILVN